MSGWDDTPATTAEDGGFTADAGNSGGDAWGSGTGPGFDDQLGEENISKHANGDGGCRNCHAEGHFARDCPEPKQNTGECYNCGEQGHNKSECTNPRVERKFTGTCNLCGEAGHRRADCPQKGPETCRACGKEGHIATECTANRLLAAYKVDTELTAEQAWEALQKADAEKDVEEIKKSILAYAKAYPELTLYDLESSFRDANFNTYLIGKEQAISVTHTIVNLEGKPGQKFVVSVQWADKPRRAKFAEGWPTSKEDNMARLAEAGFVLDGFVTKCDNCNEIGHTRAKCPEEKREPEKVVMLCVICSEEGHRARDCKAERPKPGGGRTCRNCGGEGHKASDCTEERNMDLVECKNCSQMGHFSKDCPDREPELCRNCQEPGHRAAECDKERVMKCRNCDGLGHISRECPLPKDMSKVQCRNCDEFGHTSRECPKPTDWSRVECTNCHQKGHSYKRCTNEAAPADGDAGGDGGWGDSGAAAGGDGGWGGDAGSGGGASGGW